MSGISTGIGLVSGIDRTSLIDQLMAIEQRPVQNLLARVQTVDVQRAAFLGLSAQILALQSAANRFAKISLFRQFNSASTNENILTAEAGEFAQSGVYSFRVHGLATNHSVLSRGFHDADTTPIGVGTLTISQGQSRVNRGTELNALNGGLGVGRGVITITDRAGETADIDLTRAVTVQDILVAINGEESLNVRARVSGVPFGAVTGDRIVIEDLTTELLATGNLVIADKGLTTTAADLGIVADTSEQRVDGTDLIKLSMSTFLSQLNDGNGIGTARFGRDDLIIVKGGTTNESFTVSLSNLLKFDTDLRALNNGAGVRLDGSSVMRLTDRSGATVDVDLSDLNLANGVRIQDVIDRIEQETENAGVKISVGLVDSSLQILDETGVEGEHAGNLIVEDVSGFLAADLGILGDVADKDIQGRDIYRVSTIGDVINAINYVPGNNDAILHASLSADGKGIRLQALEFGSTVTVGAAENSSAAEDLGLLGATTTPDSSFESRRLVGGLNTVLLRSLRGGSGISTGVIQLTDRGNRTTTIDFRDPARMPVTLQDVIDLINLDENTSLVASVNAAGTGIEIRDESTDAGPGGFVAITDLEGGAMAAELGIARAFGEFDGGVVDGGHLHRRYVSTQTLLSDLNAGRGVTRGDFRITDSNGSVYVIQFSDNDSIRTVGALIEEINRVAPASLEARLNDTGDGIMIIDQTDGSGTLTIEDIDGGHAAASLHLAGSARAGASFIDGSGQIRIDIGPTDTLNDVSRMINEASGLAAAAVLDDGGTANPFSLTVTSTESGRRGELLFDTGGLELGLRTMTRGQDAVITTGDSATGQSALITSATNTLDNVIDGVTLDLLAAGDEEVTITVSQDIDRVVGGIQHFVDAYNELQASIAETVSFDSDSLRRGPLLGDGAITQVRGRLHRVVTQSFEGADPSLSRVLHVGIRAVADHRIEFDEAKFRKVYEESPELVEQLFTAEDTGFGAILDETLEGLAGRFDSVLSRKNDLLTNQQELLNGRIDRLNVLLEAKRLRLEAQFIGLESSLAVIQGQQASLNILAQLASSIRF